MDDAPRPQGSRRAKLESRRRQRNGGYGRFLGYTALGSLIPGAGLIAAGKRRIGTFIVGMLLLGLAAAAAVVVMVPSGKLAGYTFDSQMLLLSAVGLGFGAVFWLAIAVATQRSLEPAGLSPAQRSAGSLVVVLTASIVVAPMSYGARAALTQRDLIGAISGDGTSQTTPEIADKSDPWKDKPQLNILVLGGDGGEGREGIRPDTQIVTSIDTHTGDTTMISLPRNMQHMPFPENSEPAKYYPNGYEDPSGEPLEGMLNSVYRNVPAQYPEISGSDANKWAVEGALGIEIDYYVMVDLQGFQTIVDAMGGITLDVSRDIPIGNKSLPGGGCTEATGWIEEGPNQKLDGYEALWFARSRCGSDDYDRMARQQCVMDAIVDEADPATLLADYQKLAAAAKDVLFTDIPEDLWPALVELGVKVKGASLESLSLDDEFFASMGTSSANPDYDELHVRIDEILAPEPEAPETPATTAPDTIDAAPDAEAPAEEAAPAEEPSPDATEPAERDPMEPVEASSVC